MKVYYNDTDNLFVCVADSLDMAIEMCYSKYKGEVIMKEFEYNGIFARRALEISEGIRGYFNYFDNINYDSSKLFKSKFIRYRTRAEKITRLVAK